MVPFVFEWEWDAGYLIFMGLLYMVIGAISLGMMCAVIKTWLDLKDK